MARREKSFLLHMLVVDSLILLSSTVFSSVGRLGFERGLSFVGKEPLSLLVVLLAYVLSFYVADLYNTKKDYRTLKEVVNIAAACLAATIGAAVLFYIHAPLRLSRGILLIQYFYVFSLVVAWRWCFVRYAAQVVARDIAVVVGVEDGDPELGLLEEIESGGIGITGLISRKIPPQQKVAGYDVLGHTGDLEHIVRQHEARKVLVKADVIRDSATAKGLCSIARDGAEVKELLAFYEEFTGKVPLEGIDYSWFLVFSHKRSSMYELKIKRIVDVVVSSVGLAVLSPALLFGVIAVKCSSRGRILYRQSRVGRNGVPFHGVPFQLLKLRTLQENAEEDVGAVWIGDNGNRVTRVGRHLRRYRVDEIPQLVNVLKGEMSLVGPRPERPEIIESQLKDIPYYAERLQVRPGITGWAQVNYGYAASREESTEKLKFDLYYVKNVSLMFDCLILLRTILVVLSARGT